MSVLDSELTSFMRRYELATNRHDFGPLVPLIAEDATYWFTEGSYHGTAAIQSGGRAYLRHHPGRGVRSDR